MSSKPIEVALEDVSSNLCHGAKVQVFKYDSPMLGCKMKFAAIVPPQAEKNKVPVLYWLSGLTCTEQNFITKAGAVKSAAEHGVMIICPDTSPRDLGIKGEKDSDDFGEGASFYVDATQEPWKKNYKMFSYITQELPQIVNQSLPADESRISIFGHSMGGHGALICALKNPGMYKSVSAFAPIAHPSEAPWGKKAFTGYLGSDREAWAEYDATSLAGKYDGPKLEIIIDQGTNDKFYYKEGQLHPLDFVKASAGTGLAVALRMREGYDHSYYFITTFIDDHIKFHAMHLKNTE